MPGGGIAVTSQPAVETNVGTVATIPAGLPTGGEFYPGVILSTHFPPCYGDAVLRQPIHLNQANYG
jgi:hypothetical protein